MHISVWHHHGILFPQDIMPRADGRRAFTDNDVARLTIVVTEGAVRLLHHIGSPYHLRCGPVHHDILPVAEVFRHPNLCWTIAVASTVGGGIEIIGVAKLTNRGVGEIAWDNGIAGTRGIPLGCVWLVC